MLRSWIAALAGRFRGVDDNPITWIADLKQPNWDQYFLALVFLAAQRSPDQQTKQGAVIVDWPTKTIMGIGYNGHPRGTSDLPTMRYGSVLADQVEYEGKTYLKGHVIPDYSKIYPDDRERMEAEKLVQGKPDKYRYMCHCETNAMLNITGSSDDAVLYVPMPSCDACASLMTNHPNVKIRRVVFYEKRPFDTTLFDRKGIKLDCYDAIAKGEPYDLLAQAGAYAKVRKVHTESLSAGSLKVYRGDAA